MICEKHKTQMRKGKWTRYCKECQTEKWAKTDEERASQIRRKVK
jgi:hypothetical protein